MSSFASDRTLNADSGDGLNLVLGCADCDDMEWMVRMAKSSSFCFVLRGDMCAREVVGVLLGKCEPILVDGLWCVAL